MLRLTPESMDSVKLAKNLVLWPVDRLKPYGKNARTHSPEQVDQIAASIAEFGFTNPILVDTEDGIIAGHGRLMAAQKLGLSEVPVVVLDHLSDAQRRAYIIADNKLALNAGWDDDMLADELRALDEEGFDLGLTGFSDDELAGLLPEVEKLDPQSDEDDVPDALPDPKVVRGEVYILGKHRLMCGDSTAITDVENLLEGKKAEMVFTDPPYGIDYTGGHFHSGDVNVKREREKIQNDDSDKIYADVIPVIAEFCDGPCYTWFADRKPLKLYQAVLAYGEIHAQIIWHKTNATYAAMGAQYKQRHEPCLYWKPSGSTLRWQGPTDECTIWEIKRDGRNEFHPTQKPVELSERAIDNHDAKTVLDLFGGSGSTLIACEKLKRSCKMMELSPAYCQVILDRWQNYTGKKAYREDGKSWDEIKAQ